MTLRPLNSLSYSRTAFESPYQRAASKRTVDSTFSAIAEARRPHTQGVQQGKVESSRYKIDSTVHSMTLTAALEKNGSQGVVRLTEEQLAEIALYDEQMRAREATFASHAQVHPDRIYGQVVVGNKLYATAYASGGVVTPGSMELTMNQGAGTSLADARLAEIAKKTGGQVIRDHFLPTEPTVTAVVPDSVLPRVTARHPGDILAEIWYSKHGTTDRQG